MNLGTALKNALKEYFEKQHDLDIAEIVSFHDEKVYGGYCETCAFEEMRLVLTYKDSQGVTQSYTHWENFSDLIESLLYYSENNG